MCSNMFNATYIDSVTFDIFLQIHFYTKYSATNFIILKFYCFGIQIIFSEFIVKNFLKIIRNYAVFNATNAARSIPYFYIVL